MNIRASNRVIAILITILALLFGALVWEAWGHFRLQLEATFAEGQTRTFDEARAQALRSDAPGAASFLEYITAYYPSGSKQRIGSHMDSVVERHRNLVIHDIIQYLRQKTGEDLGDNPEAWIQKYGKRQ